MQIKIRFYKFLLIILTSLVFLVPNFSFANNFNNFEENLEPTKEIEITIFGLPSCPHCLRAQSFFYYLKEEQGLKFSLQEYDISKSLDKAQEFYDKYQVSRQEYGLVPIIFLNDNYYLGFNEEIANILEQNIRENKSQEFESSNNLKVPFLGNLEVNKYSLPVLTVIFGIVDGFNVCSLGALIIVLGLVSVLRSRKRILSLGGAFILTTAIIYLLLIFAWHQFFILISPYIRSLEILIGLIALLGGAYLLREFIKAYKSGPICESNNLISRLSKKIEKAFQNKTNIFFLLGAVILFAGAVTIIEFPCSAALPVLFAGILVESGLSLGNSIAYMALYMLFYLLDELIIFLIALFTLKIKIVSSRFIIFFNLLAAIIFLFLGIYYIF